MTRAEALRRMRAAADTLEAHADAGAPLDPHDQARLAVDMRDWLAALDPPQAMVLPFVPRVPRPNPVELSDADPA
jgi:hypothetical protein